jgi:hypothetical protein
MYSELYNEIIKRASQKFNLDPEILKHVDTRLIVNALLLPNNHNIMVLKSHYDTIAKKFGAWRNFNHCVTDMKERQHYDDDVARKVCGKLKHQLEKTNITTAAANVKQQVDETAEKITEQVVNKLNEKLQDALKQWEMVLKQMKVQRNPDGSIVIPDYAEKFMTEVHLVAKPVCSKPQDGIVKSTNVGTSIPTAAAESLSQLHQKIDEKLEEKLGKEVVAKDHQGADSFHVTLYFATPEPKSESEIRQLIESTGAIVLSYQPASGYWLDPNGKLVGDEFVHVVTVDVKPDQLAELDRKIKNEFKQPSVLITSAHNIDGYTGGKVLRYEVPKTEEEIRQLLSELSAKYGGATYLRGKNPSIITIAQLQNDEKPEVYYHFT